MIYHITTTEDWNLFQNKAWYFPGGFEKEGFIHCSTNQQVPGVLKRYYEGVRDLIMLHIDETKLTAEVKFEEATNNELFPHVFGPINKEAIVKVERI